jgi:hypothetical protein
MAAPDRTVRHLRLRAQDEADVRRTARQLEDALRCASLPDAGGRLLLVRRLDLGRLRADITPHELALLLERRVQECGYTWVHGAALDAPQANAVWFRDAGEALLTLALQVLHGMPNAAAWFWRHVLPTYSPTCGMVQTLESIVTHLAALPTGGVVLAELVATLARAITPQAVPACFSPTAQRVLQAVARQQGMPTPHVQLIERNHGPRSWRSLQGEVLTLTPSLQAQAPWLAILLATAGWSAAREHVEATSSSESVGSASSSESAAVQPRAQLAVIRAEPAAQATHGSTRLSHSHVDHTATAATSLPALHAPSAPSTDPAAREHIELVVPVPSPAATQPPAANFSAIHASNAAGILFLLPLLARLGFDAWSATLTPLQAQCVAIGVLRRALQRLRVCPDDPAYALLRAWPQHCLPCSAPCSAPETPAVWRDPRINLQMPLEPDSTQLAVLWLTACRRSLRRVARIGLASLVLRAGALAWSLTHLDAHFDLKDTDLRVRRNALDVDAGWLPWIGRVVSFHYVREHNM